jgi:hypothetical protein
MIQEAERSCFLRELADGGRKRLAQVGGSRPPSSPGGALGGIDNSLRHCHSGRMGKPSFNQSEDSRRHRPAFTAGALAQLQVQAQRANEFQG